MSVRKTKKEFQEGMQKLGDMFDSLMERHVDPNNQPKRSNVSLVLGLIPHLVILVLSTAVVWLAKPSSSLFSWHPTLMTLAYVVLMTEALLLFSPWSSPVLNQTDLMGARAIKIQWHWILQVCALVSSFTGIIIISANKIINGYPHYTSYHGVLGIFLSGYVFLQMSSGIALKFPDILPFKVRPITQKRMHALSGVLTYFCGLTTVTLGLFSSWFVANCNPVVWKVCIACPALLGIAVLIQIVRNYVWR